MPHIAIDEPKPFDLIVPASLSEAIELGDRYGTTGAYLAGGCDLMDQLKHQMRTSQKVINLKGLRELQGVSETPLLLRLGALVTLAEIGRREEIRQKLPALAHAATRVATPQIRNAATIGGNLLQDSRCAYYRGGFHCYRAGGIVCDARRGINEEHALFGGDRCYTVSPSDLAPAIVALNGHVSIVSSEGERWLPAAHLFASPGQNVRAMHHVRSGEILTAIEIPIVPDQHSTFIKYGMRNAWDFALASVAVSLRVERGRCRDCRIVLGAVAAVPWRSRAAEQAVEGHTLVNSVIEEASNQATDGATSLSHNSYKLGLIRKLVRAAFRELANGVV